MPTSSISFSPCSGVSSTWTPSASSASALPEEAEIEREPCLATGTPAAAVRMAFAELTLKVLRPPPVPHMSVRRPLTCGLICTQFARMARAIAATSSTVGPFITSATRKPAIWTSVITSSRMSSTNSVSSAALSSLPWVSLPSDSLNTGGLPWMPSAELGEGRAYGPRARRARPSGPQRGQAHRTGGGRR